MRYEATENNPRNESNQGNENNPNDEMTDVVLQIKENIYAAV